MALQSFRLLVQAGKREQLRNRPNPASPFDHDPLVALAAHLGLFHLSAIDEDVRVFEQLDDERRHPLRRGDEHHAAAGAGEHHVEEPPLLGMFDSSGAGIARSRTGSSAIVDGNP